MSNVYFLFLLQIDSSVIDEIDDATMASYIPAYGDRIATRRFCMEKQRRGGDDTKRLSLYQKKTSINVLRGRIQCNQQICV